MVNFTNVTLNFSKQDVCDFPHSQITVLSLVDISMILIGQPVIAKLLWITFTSKKTTDILHFNLALFHNLQYLILIMHLICVLLMSPIQQQISDFLFMYVQIGGPMSLSFICLERYVAVIHPTSYPLLKKYRFREVCALTVWLLSVPSAVVNVLAPSASSLLTDIMLKYFPPNIMCVMSVMMVGCSSRIARVLKKSSPGNDKQHPVKKRAFKIVRATSILTMFCYAPVALIQCIGYFDEFFYECVITPACILFMSVASVVHPMLYLSSQGKLGTHACRALIQ